MEPTRIMRTWVSLATLSLYVLRFYATYAQCPSASIPPPTPSTLVQAKAVAHRLQDHYLLPSGLYSDTPDTLWTGANTIEDIHNLMLASGTFEFDDAAENSFIGQMVHNSSTNWRNVFGGNNGGLGWFVLALSKIADYQKLRKRDAAIYTENAKTIYSIMESQWDDTCGGGIWMNIEHTSKSANSNHLFLLVSADGYLRFKEQKYLDNAQKAWKWLSASGMRNEDGLWHSGMESSTTSSTDPRSCPIVDQMIWTCDQGVIASGLAALFVATGDTSLLDQAEITLDATIRHLTANNVLKDACEDQAGCNTDQQMFKGVWIKHLRYYLNYADSPNRTQKYIAFLQAQSSAVQRATNADGDISYVWYAPDKDALKYNPRSTASGLAAYVAAAIDSSSQSIISCSESPTTSTSRPSTSAYTTATGSSGPGSSKIIPEPTAHPDPQPNISSRTIIGVSVGVPIAVIVLAIFIYWRISKIHTPTQDVRNTASLRVVEPFKFESQSIIIPRDNTLPDLPPPYTKAPT